MLKNFNIFTDDRGKLIPIEFDNLPFKPVRTFLVYDVPNGTIRGNHAHYNTKQLLICLKGKIIVNTHNGKKWSKRNIYSSESFLIDNLIWDNQQFFNNAIMLVLCSVRYMKNDYINDFESFLTIYKRYCVE